VTYNYTVTNTGDTTLTNVNIIDSDLGFIASNVTLNPGQNAIYLDSTHLNNTTTNSANATGTDIANVTVMAEASATVNVVHPAISLTVKPSSSQVGMGSTVNFTYTAVNTGDTSLTFNLSDSFGSIFTGNALAVGASNTTTVAHVLFANTTDNAVAVGADLFGGIASNYSSVFVQVIPSSMSLVVTPSSPTVEANSSVSFTYLVINTGGNPLTVNLTDSLFGSILINKMLAVGASCTTILATVLTANTTDLAASTAVDNMGTTISANANTTVQVFVGHPALSLTVIPSSSIVDQGSSVDYTYTVSNTGNTPLIVNLTDNVFGTLFMGKLLSSGSSNTTIITEVLTANTTNTATATGTDPLGLQASATGTAFVATFNPQSVTVTFNENGIGTDFTGTMLTVDGVTYNATELPLTFSWGAGSTHTFAFASPLAVTMKHGYGWWSTSGLTTLQKGTLKVTLSGEIDAAYGISGDFTHDGKVNLADLVILAKAYGSHPGDARWNPACDIANQGSINLADLCTFVQHYGDHS
jgi:hypothetical protein